MCGPGPCRLREPFTGLCVSHVRFMQLIEVHRPARHKSRYKTQLRGLVALDRYQSKKEKRKKERKKEKEMAIVNVRSRFYRVGRKEIDERLESRLESHLSALQGLSFARLCPAMCVCD